MESESFIFLVVQESAGLSAVSLNKKQGVSGQSVSTSHKVSIEKVDKDFHSRTLIKDAIQDNDFLKNLTPSQVNVINKIKLLS